MFNIVNIATNSERAEHPIFHRTCSSPCGSLYYRVGSVTANYYIKEILQWILLSSPTYHFGLFGLFRCKSSSDARHYPNEGKKIAKFTAPFTNIANSTKSSLGYLRYNTRSHNYSTKTATTWAKFRNRWTTKR